MKKRRLKKAPILVLFCLLLALGTGLYQLRKKEVRPVAAETPTPEPTVEPEIHQAEFFFTGDALIHGTVWMEAEQPDGSYDFTGILEKMGELARGYDLKYYNQETILGGTELGLHGYPRFNSPQEVGDAMVSLGFNLVSTANNHSLDKDMTGIERSAAYWKRKETESGVHMSGTFVSQEEADAIPVYEVNGITYTFLSWTYGCNGLTAPADRLYAVNVYTGNEERLLEQVRTADGKSDVVIVAMHWGTEYSMEANQEQRTLAAQLAQAGADIIVGNHPHVIQPVEWIGDTICYYAMGNMVSAQINEENLVGMVGAVSITKTTDAAGTNIKIDNARADLIYTYYIPVFHGFKVIPFDELDEAHLPGHEAIYEKYRSCITKYDDRIQIGGIRKRENS